MSIALDFYKIGFCEFHLCASLAGRGGGGGNPGNICRQIRQLHTINLILFTFLLLLCSEWRLTLLGINILSSTIFNTQIPYIEFDFAKATVISPRRRQLGNWWPPCAPSVACSASPSPSPSSWPTLTGSRIFHTNDDIQNRPSYFVCGVRGVHEEYVMLRVN
jgi:hypothetical protein